MPIGIIFKNPPQGKPQADDELMGNNIDLVVVGPQEEAARMGVRRNGNIEQEHSFVVGPFLHKKKFPVTLRIWKSVGKGSWACRDARMNFILNW